MPRVSVISDAFSPSLRSFTLTEARALRCILAVASESVSADWTLNTPFGPLQESYSGRNFLS